MSDGELTQEIQEMLDNIEKQVKKYSFNVESGYMVVSDPCYDVRRTNNRCFRILAVEPGEWIIKSIRKHIETEGLGEEEGTSGRICRFTIGHKKKKPLEIWDTSDEEEEKEEKGEKLGRVSVDSGQMSFCDMNVYRNDNGIEEDELWDEYEIKEEGDRFYSKMCKITMNIPGYAAFKGGCVTQSGWGDGCYEIFGKNNENMTLSEITIDFY